MSGKFVLGKHSGNLSWKNAGKFVLGNVRGICPGKMSGKFVLGNVRGISHGEMSGKFVLGKCPGVCPCKMLAAQLTHRHSNIHTYHFRPAIHFRRTPTATPFQTHLNHSLWRQCWNSNATGLRQHSHDNSTDNGH